LVLQHLPCCSKAPHTGARHPRHSELWQVHTPKEVVNTLVRMLSTPLPNSQCTTALQSADPVAPTCPKLLFSGNGGMMPAGMVQLSAATPTPPAVSASSALSRTDPSTSQCSRSSRASASDSNSDRVAVHLCKCNAAAGGELQGGRQGGMHW
jgi:hypothetical protein